MNNINLSNSLINHDQSSTSLVIIHKAELPWVGKYFINFKIILQNKFNNIMPNKRLEQRFLFVLGAMSIRGSKRVARALKISTLSNFQKLPHCKCKFVPATLCCQKKLISVWMIILKLMAFLRKCTCGRMTNEGRPIIWHMVRMVTGTCFEIGQSEAPE